MIVSRYLRKEVIYTMMAVTSIVVFIFICNQFVRYLDYVATGKYAANTVAQLILLEIPMLFSILLPLGLFLGILLGYGRLYADSEMTVLMACGYSKEQLLATTMKYATSVFIVVSVLVFWLGPIIATHRDRLMDIAESGSIVQTLLPGQFQSVLHGKRVLYVQSMSKDHQQAHNVFIAEQLHRRDNAPASAADNWAILTAQRSQSEIDPKTGDHFVVLKNGYRYQGIPGTLNFQVVQFGSYHIRLGDQFQFGRNEGVEILSTWQLIKTALHNKENMAELQWRISIPLSVLILALLAVPFSRVKPRQGRFVWLLPAVLIYVLYANMIFVSRGWLEEGSIPAWLGVWWIHLLVLGFALFLIKRDSA